MSDHAQTQILTYFENEVTKFKYPEVQFS